MNIALVGAPGSGKSDLAYQLRGRLDKTFDPECGCGERKIQIVDHYIGDIEAKTQIALGPLANYVGNLYVALERYARERVARMDAEMVITCGTLIETAVYLAMHFVSLANVLGEDERAGEAPRIDAALRIMAILYTDIFSYDHAFYLPPTQADEDTAFIDRQLQAALEGFKLIPVTPLTNPDTKIEDVLAVLERKHEVSAS